MSDLSSSIENPGQANNDSKNVQLIQHTDVQNRDELIGESSSCCARKFNSTIDMLDNVIPDRPTISVFMNLLGCITSYGIAEAFCAMDMDMNGVDDLYSSKNFFLHVIFPSVISYTAVLLAMAIIDDSCHKIHGYKFLDSYDLLPKSKLQTLSNAYLGCFITSFMVHSMMANKNAEAKFLVPLFLGPIASNGLFMAGKLIGSKIKQPCLSLVEGCKYDVSSFLSSSFTFGSSKKKGAALEISQEDAHAFFANPLSNNLEDNSEVARL